MPEMHLKHPGSTYSVCGVFTKNKESKQEIQIISTKLLLIKSIFNMSWIMVNTKIWLNEQNQTKC